MSPSHTGDTAREQSPDAGSVDRPVSAVVSNAPAWRGSDRPGLTSTERLVWAAAVLTGALDVLLTLYGLRLGFVEVNPVAAAAVGSVGPVPGLVGLKLLALALLAVGTLPLPRAPVRSSPPAFLAVTWGGAAAYNCWLVLL